MNENESKINEIDLSIWDIETKMGKPHSHIEIVGGEEVANRYEKAAKEVGSIAIRRVNFLDEAVLEKAPTPSAAAYWRQNAENLIGYEISTVADQQGKHPDLGTTDFYKKVSEIESQEQ